MAVGFSHREAGAQAARHLVSRGRRRLAAIGADQVRSRMRLGGFARHVANAGLSFEGTQLAAPPSSIELGRELMGRLAAASPGVDGVFCSNDLLAIGALLWARDNGWAVPGRLAVVGFSDLAIAQAASPPLTTVRVDASEIGRRAGALVLARLRAERARAKTVDVGFTLVERASA